MADDPEADADNGAPPLPVQESIYDFVVKVNFSMIFATYQTQLWRWQMLNFLHV